MLKKLLVCFFVCTTITSFCFYEINCRHGFNIVNRTIFPIKLEITGFRESKSFITDTINPEAEQKYRFNLRGFEGDLLIEIKNLTSNEWRRYNTNYTYQGDAANYHLIIYEHDMVSEATELKASFLNHIKFFFTSFARYNGCLMPV